MLLFVEFSLLHQWNAIWMQEINSFPNIKTLGKAAMVGFEKCTDIVPWALIGFINRDPVINKLKRVNHKSDAIEKGFLAVFIAIG